MLVKILRWNRIGSRESHGAEVAQLIVRTALLISVLQAILFVMGRPWSTYNAIGILAAVSFLVVFWIYASRNSRRLFTPLLILFLAEAVIFFAQPINIVPPFSFRMIWVALAAAYLATLVIFLLAISGIQTPSNALMTVSLCAVAFVLMKGILGQVSSLVNREECPVFSCPLTPSPELGYIHYPNSTIKSFYPDNNRGYFRQGGKWELNVNEGNSAKMKFSRQSPEAIRVEINKATTDKVWDIQLTLNRLAAVANQRYLLSFRARADGVRTIGVAFGKAYAPWDLLGLGASLTLSREWQYSYFDFQVIANDDNARLIFDAGASATSFELSDIHLIRLSDEKVIVPPEKPYVSYSFNALGCRGHDYPIPKIENSIRIALLGDSYTLGIGVHEDDTAAAQLERLLNEKGKHRYQAKLYEVINCGNIGRGLSEDLSFFQTFAWRYKPDLVLLVMFNNSFRSWIDDSITGYPYRSGKIDQFLYSWALIQHYIYSNKARYGKSFVDELLKLNETVQKRGARFALLIFHGEQDKLSTTITKLIRNIPVPLGLIGEGPFGSYTREELAVDKIDPHPNEIANSIIAREILKFLLENNLL